MTVSKKFILTFMLLAFIGQGIAASASHCLDAMDDSVQMHNTMDHSQHQPMTPDTDQMMGDCDMQNCKCNLGGCSLAMVSASVNRLSLNFHMADNNYQNSHINQPLSTRFRPPISR